VVHLPHIDYLSFAPEIATMGGALVLLALSSVVRRTLRATVATATTVVVALVALGLSLWQWADIQQHGPYLAVARALSIDGFAVLVNILLSCTLLLTALVAHGYLEREDIQGPEYHVLAMISITGAMLMGSANDLVIVFLGLEIMSIALYVLTAFNHRRAASGEAALKYFILGGFSSAVFVYGIALTYGATGSTNIGQIADFLSKNVLTTDGVLLAGLALLLVGFGFKIAAVPFHMWTPDVYQGAPSPVTGFMAAVAKIGGFAALLRVFISSFGTLQSDWRPLVYALAVASLVLGAVLAVVQRDVKRMMAYSSINHAGFILLGLVAATTAGVSASLYYLVAYTFMVVGSFAILTVLGGRGDRDHDLNRYRGLAGRQPVVAVSLAVLLLAQAGMPFTTGLWAKLGVVDAAVNADSVPLAAIAMVTAAIAAFFYLRVAVLMYSPTRAPAGLEAPAGELGPGEAWGNGAGAGTSPGGEAAAPDAVAGAPGPSGATAPVNLVPVDLSAQAETVSRMNAVLLLEPDDGAAPEGSATPAADGDDLPEAVPVPWTARAAIALCLGVTVVFGVWPAPLQDFAHQATLLIPH
jgi:NADH-quinone oxidoreductase subunit N